MNSRGGAPKAVTATAHTRARLISSMLKHGTAYGARGMADYERPYRERAVQHRHRRAQELGDAVHLAPEGTLA
jgi:transposase